MRETIEVHYTCGCSATGLKPTHNEAGVPKHCALHGTAGDDMRVQDSGAESTAEGSADGTEQAEAPDSNDEPPATDPATPEGE